MTSLQSAAFTFLVPAGCVYDPADRGGLSSFTCEMALRGAGQRDSRQFILDLDNLGVERSESVSNAHTSYSGATLAENLPQALAIYADVLRRPHLPDDQLEAGRLAMLQELAGGRGRAGAEGDDRAAPAALSRPVGPAVARRAGRRSRRSTIDDIRRHFAALLSAQRHDPRRGRAIRLGAAEGRWSASCSAIGRRGETDDRRRNARRVPLRAPALRFAADADRHRLRQRALSRIPTTFRRGARWACLSGGMSARLFTEVRERRGLCYSVYASLPHAARSRRACSATPAPAPSGPRRRST